jgi:hypothetical protein
MGRVIRNDSVIDLVTQTSLCRGSIFEDEDEYDYRSLRDPSYRPSGTDRFGGASSRHFMPGYLQAVPPGLKPRVSRHRSGLHHAITQVDFQIRSYPI